MTSLLSYLAPPLLGAFIGYLTNRVAIRMLFRPLKTWYVFGVRVPMTPGVIPSKRHALAKNIGEMVGDHLLTSQDIGEALSEEPFQDHLQQIVEIRFNELLHQDLGAIPELIPKRFRAYFRIGIKTLKYQVAEGLHRYLHDDTFAAQLTELVEEQLEVFLRQPVNDIVSEEKRARGYSFVSGMLDNFLSSPELEQWLGSYLHEQVIEAARSNRSLGDMLPDSLQDMIAEAVRERAPGILERLALVLAEPPVRKRIVKAARRAVDDFLESLGPMADMAANFINLETVEGRIQSYLDSKEEEIIKWLQNTELQERVAAVLEEHTRKFIHTPINQLLQDVENERIESLSRETAGQLAAVFRSKDVSEALADMLAKSLEKAVDNGELPMGEVLEELFSEEGADDLRKQLSREVLILLRSQQVAKLLRTMTGDMLNSLLAQRLGMLERLVPPGVHRGTCSYLTMVANRMLLKEVPGLVDSLHIRRLVTEKVDSLDLLRLERLLLSIMEEQFRYINLFGALLGFLIGCLNLLAMQFI